MILWYIPDFPSKSGESVLIENGAQVVIVDGPECSFTIPVFILSGGVDRLNAIDRAKVHPSDRRIVDIECNIF